MQLSKFASLTIALLAALASASSAERVKCSVSADPTTCAKGQYCLAAKPHSYCAAKLKAGAECKHDSACQSDVCFVAKTKKGKRVCASLPLKNYPLGAQCTQSTQCKDKFCDLGYCKKPVGAGEKCPKEAGCADLKLGAHCLDAKATYTVYDSSGTPSTKKLSAGHCSYVRNLGEGMKCSSDANCFTDRFYCSASKTCTEKQTYGSECTRKDMCQSQLCVPPNSSGRRRGLPSFAMICGCSGSCSDIFDPQYCEESTHLCREKKVASSSCEASEECESGSCNAGFCACLDDASPCPSSTDYCDASTSTCKPKSAYGEQCSTNSECALNSCVVSPYGRRRSNYPPWSMFCSCAGDDSVCASAEYCDANGVCVDKLAVGSSCTTDSQCSHGCVADQCACATNDDCSGDEVCDGESQQCVASGGGCRRDAAGVRRCE